MQHILNTSSKNKLNMHWLLKYSKNTPISLKAKYILKFVDCNEQYKAITQKYPLICRINWRFMIYLCKNTVSQYLHIDYGYVKNIFSGIIIYIPYHGWRNTDAETIAPNLRFQAHRVYKFSTCIWAPPFYLAHLFHLPFLPPVYRQLRYRKEMEPASLFRIKAVWWIAGMPGKFFYINAQSLRWCREERFFLRK